jgi:hypothetical protein
MNPDRDLAHELDAWLAQGPTTAPDRVLDGVIAALASTHQRRTVAYLPWTLRAPAPRLGLLLAVAAAGVVIVGGLAQLENAPSNLGARASSPTALPTASATSVSPASIDTSGWPSFTSTRNGLSVQFPTGWTATPATRAWPVGVPFPRPEDYRAASAMLDTFVGADGPIFAAGSQPLAPSQSSPDAWLTRFEATGRGTDPVQCWPAPADMEHATIGGVRAWIRSGCGATDVILFVGGRVYIFRAEIDPTLNRPLFDAFLSTVRLTPAAARDAPEPPAPSTTPPV